MFFYLDFFDESNSRVAFYPQVMLVTSAVFEIQIGLGISFSKDKFSFQLVHRPTILTPS